MMSAMNQRFIERPLLSVTSNWIDGAAADTETFELPGNRLDFVGPHDGPYHLHRCASYSLFGHAEKFASLDSQLADKHLISLPPVLQIQHRNDEHVQNRGRK